MENLVEISRKLATIRRIVCKSADGRVRFKVISNKFLLDGGEDE